MTKTLPETLEEIKNLRTFLVEAEQALIKGKQVDLTGIDDRIITVCNVVQNAKDIQKEIYISELKKLLQLLGKCQQTLYRMQQVSLEAKDS